MPAQNGNAAENLLYPFHVFKFHVDFFEVALSGENRSGSVPLCSGAFAECTGLEATMEPKAIKAGGRNYGAAQRVGPVSFATVILRRGMTTTRDLWKWFELIAAQNKYAYRLDVAVTMHDHQDRPAITYRLANALPTKFKAADLNAKSQEVGIEELHLVHEGLSVESHRT